MPPHPSGYAALVLTFWYDVVCPYSYLLMAEIERVEDAGLPVRWAPFELRPAPDPLPEPRGRYIRDHWREAVYPLATAYGTEIHVPRFQPRSTLALAAAQEAERRGAGRAWRREVQAAFFIAGEDVSDERVLRGCAARAGLDGDEVVAAAWDPDGLRALRGIRAEALAAGVHGVPSLTVDGTAVFFGAPPPGRVARALQSWDGDGAGALRRALSAPAPADRETSRGAA